MLTDIRVAVRAQQEVQYCCSKQQQEPRRKQQQQPASQQEQATAALPKSKWQNHKTLISPGKNLPYPLNLVSTIPYISQNKIYIPTTFVLSVCPCLVGLRRAVTAAAAVEALHSYPCMMLMHGNNTRVVDNPELYYHLQVFRIFHSTDYRVVFTIFPY